MNRRVGLWEHTHTQKIKEERNEIEGRRISNFLSVFMPLLPFYFRRGDILFLRGIVGRARFAKEKKIFTMLGILLVWETLK